MAKQLSASIEIDATPSRVWEILTDFSAYPEWNPFLVSATGSPVEGARLTVRMQPDGGRAITFRPTVRSATPARRLVWLGRTLAPGIFDGEHRFDLTPTPSGGTRLVQAEEYRGVLVPFLSRSLDKRTLPAFERMNRALKERAERA